MRELEDELDGRNVKVLVVTFQADFMAKAYVEDTDLKWPLLVDETRELYQGYDMLTASFWDLWGPKTWMVYMKELWKGQKLQKGEADVSQRGGDVLVDPEGVVRIHHVGPGPADRPSVESIMEAIRKGS